MGIRCGRTAVEAGAVIFSTNLPVTKFTLRNLEHCNSKIHVSRLVQRYVFEQCKSYSV